VLKSQSLLNKSTRVNQGVDGKNGLDFQEMNFVYARFRPSMAQIRVAIIVKYYAGFAYSKISLTVPSRGPKDELNTKKLTNPGDVFMVAILDWVGTSCKVNI